MEAISSNLDASAATSEDDPHPILAAGIVLKPFVTIGENGEHVPAIAFEFVLPDGAVSMPVALVGARVADLPRMVTKAVRSCLKAANRK